MIIVNKITYDKVQKLMADMMHTTKMNCGCEGFNADVECWIFELSSILNVDVP